MLVGQSTAWRKLNLPAGVNQNLRSVVATPNGYVYISSDKGIYRAPVTNPAAWTSVSNGLPKTTTGYPPVGIFGVTKNGTLLAGVGLNPALWVARFDPVTLRWSLASGPSNYSQKITSFTYDSAGNVYATSAFGGAIYVSRDDGRSFKVLVNSAYNYMAQPFGAIWDAQVLHDGTIERIYWGGEGNLNVSTTDLRQNQAELTSAQGYHGNLRAIAGSGSEVLVGRTQGASGLQRFDFLTNRWTAIGPAQGLPAYWMIENIEYSPCTHEYFSTGYGSVSSEVLRSGDGGKTWSNYNAGLSTTKTYGAYKITVSPVNQSKYALTRDGASIWYHQ